LLAANGQDASDVAVLNWSTLGYLVGLAAVILAGLSSDRTGERKWHCITGQVGAGVFLALSGVSGQSWGVVFAWLCLAVFFANFWYTPFWVLPTLSLTSSAAAVSIAFINMCANTAGFIGSPTVGEMKTAGYDDRACLLFLAVCFCIGGVFVGLIRVRRETR
jgi:ACS family tartrate transporter-like MFS transporter